MDWKDALASLSADMPAAPEPLQPASSSIEEPETTDTPQNLTLYYERKGRKGKSATIIAGFDWPDSRISRLLTDLQRRLGAGGSARGGEILLQGDCRERVAALLRSMGHRVKGV